MALAVFLHLDDMSVEIYDEARRAVSAAEMADGKANLLVPTYNGAPDHWGTKPSLLVVCQAFWMKIFGVGELAVRLPSALATLLLCALLIWWGRRDWGSPLAGAMGAIVMLCCWEFMGNHGARTGDFDAMLTLFLTAQVVCFYRWVQEDKIKWLWLAGAAVTLAGLSKGIAGGFFLPGIGLWLLVTTKGRKFLLRPALYGIISLGITLVLGYYFLRNSIDPLYLEMVQNNELGGRFASTNEGHRHPFWYYGQRLVQDKTLGYLLPLLLPALLYYFGVARQQSVQGADAGAAARTQRNDNPALLVSLTALVFMTVISVAATKLYWYKTPVLPLLGILIGGFLFQLARMLADKLSGRMGKVVVVGFLAALFLFPMAQITERSMRPRNYQETPGRKLGYRDFMRAKEVEPPYTVLVRDYHPNARFYVLQAQSRGEDVRLKRTKKLLPPLVYNAAPPGGLEVGERVVVCHSETWDYLFKRFRMKEVFNQGKCKLVRLDTVRE